MKLLLRQTLERGMADFEAELSSFFETSLMYRAKLRRGTLVLVDNDSEVFDFLSFLVDKCGLNVGIMMTKTLDLAKRAIQDIGPNNVKAVLVDSDICDDVGGNMSEWLHRVCPRVPLYMLNCEPSKRRKMTTNVGVFERGDSLLEVAEGIGFPRSCRMVAQDYG